MTQALTKLRQLMKLKQLSWYILPRTDQHQSEYICQCDKRVQFISGFSGSNAMTLISHESAYLWTDGRYFLQAQNQLRQGWSLKKMIPTQKKWFELLLSEFKHQFNKIGIDSRLISASMAKQRFKFLTQAGFQIIGQAENLIDKIWQNRPQFIQQIIFSHEQWAGKTVNTKVSWVRQKIKQKNGNAALFSGLSEIAWILNLRSSQIPFNPYFKSILVITSDSGRLYLSQTHPSFKNITINDHLQKVNIKIVNSKNLQFQQKTLIQSSILNYAIYQKLKDPIQWAEGIALYRAVRDQKQIQGFRNSHIRDGIAMAKFWAWRSKQQVISQLDAAFKMNKLRTQQIHNRGTSFQTTSAGGSNAAIIHYKPTTEANLIITRDMIHLLDSGGQYLDGTTDVTRTFHFGEPIKQQKDAYTRVLLGNLDVQRMKWPNTVDIQGRDLDVLARRHLYQVGKDYQHGTGHGVGYYLGVHQGPVGISKINNTVFKPGMIVSNQPGYYEQGKFGIRIQNLIIVQEKQNGYYFENLTICPYDLNLISQQLLNRNDKDHINSYHKRIYQVLEPHLNNDQETINWLKNATRSII